MRTCIRWLYIVLLGLVVLTGALCIAQGWREGRVRRHNWPTQMACLPAAEGGRHARA